MRREIAVRALTALLTVFVAGQVFAQSGLGSISGTILDQTGGSLPGADIKIVEKSTRLTRNAISNDVGLFNAPSLPAGTYTVTVSLENFKTKEFDTLTVNSFQQLSLGQVTLELAVGPSDVVEVTASAVPLAIDSGVRSETVQADQVHDMPLQGRNWATLLKVIPGSNPTNSTAINGRDYSATGYNEFRINGKNPAQTQVNLDGGSLVDHGSDAKTTVAPSLESIQEMSVLTNNFQAEYGNRGGTVINIVTKSGTNEMRGALFDYARNEALNAGNWDDNFNHKPKPLYRYNYLGGNLGGPIRRNTLFFFYNVEDFKQALPGATLSGRVPTEAERRGDFSQTVNADGSRPTIFMPGTQSSGNPVRLANNVIPENLITPLGRAIMNAFPLPNNPGDLSNNFVQQVERTNPRISNTLKVDWNLSERSRASVRYTDDEGTQIDRSISNTSGIFPGGSVKRPRPDRAAAANYTHTFSPNLVMNSTFAWSYDFVQWLPADLNAISKKSLGLTGLPTVFPVTDDILPQMTIGTYPNWAFNRMPAYARAHEFQVGTTVSWARGTHMFKYGAQHIINYKDEVDQSVNKGFYDFSVNTSSAFDTGFAPANVLVGALSRFQQIDGLNRKYSIYRDIHAFVQDTWKPTRGLTLDYGLRLSHMPTEHNTRPDKTLDAVFLASKWDAAKAPRFYIPDPKNPSLVIDPANPGQPLPPNVASVLRYTIVPGSGDLLNGIVQLGTNGEGLAGIPDPKAILAAPRGGFAWTPFAAQKTVLRGGFGWAYNRNTISQTVNRFENGLGSAANVVQTSFDTLAASTAVQPIQAKSYGARDESGGRMPTVYDYSLSVQQQFGAKLVVDVAYIGNQQRNQPLDFNLNAIPPGTAFKPEFVDPRLAGSNLAGPISSTNPGPALPGTNTVDPVLMRPFLGFDSLMMTSNIAKVDYSSLQISVTDRLPRVTFEAWYTLGRAKGQIENTPPSNKNWQAYTGYTLSDDRRHVAAVNYIFDVAKVARHLGLDNAVGRAAFDDWKIAHLFTVVSGQDFSPSFAIQQAGTTSAVDLNRVFLGTPDFGPRVTVLGDPNRSNSDFAHQFDVSQLGVPGIYPAGDGTGPRNFLRGRGTFSNDLSLVKQFALHRTQLLELRANFYNVFNNVRRTTTNKAITFKANGRNFSDGFQIINTPEAAVERSQANGITDPLQLYNQYRSGVGHVDLTTVAPMRIIEIGLALRF
jgi:hypothetical protein